MSVDSKRIKFLHFGTEIFRGTAQLAPPHSRPHKTRALTLIDTPRITPALLPGIPLVRRCTHERRTREPQNAGTR